MELTERVRFLCSWNEHCRQHIDFVAVIGCAAEHIMEWPLCGYHSGELTDYIRRDLMYCMRCDEKIIVAEKVPWEAVKRFVDPYVC